MYEKHRINSNYRYESARVREKRAKSENQEREGADRQAILSPAVRSKWN